MLSDTQIYDALREAIRAAALMAAPILVVALAVGAVIGLLQALTSVQEMTLTFVPKLAAIAGVFWLVMGFMTQTLLHVFHTVLLPMIAGP